MVARGLDHLPAMPEVTGSRPCFGTFLRFISRIYTVSGIKGLKIVYLTLQDFNVTYNFSGDNW